MGVRMPDECHTMKHIPCWGCRIMAGRVRSQGEASKLRVPRQRMHAAFSNSSLPCDFLCINLFLVLRARSVPSLALRTGHGRNGCGVGGGPPAPMRRRSVADARSDGKHRHAPGPCEGGEFNGRRVHETKSAGFLSRDHQPPPSPPGRRLADDAPCGSGVFDGPAAGWPWWPVPGPQQRPGCVDPEVRRPICA